VDSFIESFYNQSNQMTITTAPRRLKTEGLPAGLSPARYL
jgi:hypothetical protein